MNFNIVGLSDIDALWPSISDGLSNALWKAGGDIGIGYLYQQARSGGAIVLLAHDDAIRGAGVFRPEVWETGTKLRCLAFYGDDFKAWRDGFMSACRALGKACGTDTCIFEGRKGHEALFPEAKVLRQLYEVK